MAVIEQATGIDVAVLDVGPDEHGLTMRDPVRGTIFIGVARARNPMRQRSTLAHELGHVLFGDWANSDAGDWSDRDPAEIRADAFARHLLVPAEGLRDFIGQQFPAGESGLSAVVQHFLVSPPMAAIALCQAGYIDEAAKRGWMMLSTPQLAARGKLTTHDWIQILPDDVTPELVTVVQRTSGLPMAENEACEGPGRDHGHRPRRRGS